MAAPVAPDEWQTDMPPDLVWVADTMPGIRRKKAGRGFSYKYDNGRRVTSAAVRARIKALAIPPAWQQVWICARADGHIQASGRDDKGRKQYRYHDRWRIVRDATKFDQLEYFAKALPRIRRRVRRDLAGPRNGRLRVVATVVRLLETTLIRIGTERYVRTNHSYGITTLRRRHASVKGASVRLRFRGKSGVRHDVTLDDKRLARIVRQCMDVPGQFLFQYQDADGDVVPVTSDDVNDYLKEAGRSDFTARHYRTWSASVMAMALLQRQENAESPTKTRLDKVVRQVAQRLRNTPAVCRKCYIHPDIGHAYLAGMLPPARRYTKPAGLYASERRFLRFLVSKRRAGGTLIAQDPC